MTYSSRSLRLYLSNKTYVVAVPVITLAAMVLISVVIALVMGIVVGLPLPAEAEEGFRNNIGSLTALPGFLISLGALAVNRNFAMALAFGSTRRDFWCGTALGFTATSLVTALSAVVLLALEKATNGWFVHAHAFDVAAMGNGSYPKAFAMTLMLALLSLFLGALFGTVFRAFGAKATTITASGLGRRPARALRGGRLAAGTGVHVPRRLGPLGGRRGPGGVRCRGRRELVLREPPRHPLRGVRRGGAGPLPPGRRARARGARPCSRCRRRSP